MNKKSNLQIKSAIVAGLAAIAFIFSCSSDEGGGGGTSSVSEPSSSSVADEPSSSSQEAPPISSSQPQPQSSSSEEQSSSSIAEIDPIAECIKEKLEEDSNVRHIYNTPLCEGATKEAVFAIIGDENGMFGGCVLANLPNGSFNVIFSTMKINCNYKDGKESSSSMGGVPQTSSSSSVPTPGTSSSSSQPQPGTSSSSSQEPPALSSSSSEIAAKEYCEYENGRMCFDLSIAKFKKLYNNEKCQSFFALNGSGLIIAGGEFKTEVCANNAPSTAATPILTSEGWCYAPYPNNVRNSYWYNLRDAGCEKLLSADGTECNKVTGVSGRRSDVIKLELRKEGGVLWISSYEYDTSNGLLGDCRNLTVIP